MFPPTKQQSPCIKCARRWKEKTCAVYCDEIKQYDNAIRYGKYWLTIPPPPHPGKTPDPRYASGKTWQWISPEQLKTIKRLHEKNKSAPEISKVIGFSPTAINKAIKRGFTIAAPRVTIKEKQEIIARYENGETFSAIAKKMRRGWDTIKRVITKEQKNQQAA